MNDMRKLMETIEDISEGYYGATFSKTFEFDGDERLTVEIFGVEDQGLKVAIFDPDAFMEGGVAMPLDIFIAMARAVAGAKK